jgi:thioredoxin reductase
MARVDELPVAVVGGGPIGLSAAAHLLGRGLPVKLYEAGQRVGTNLRNWGHVRTFTPWLYSVDRAARVLLERRGWRMPSAKTLPTGDELCDAYLEPLAALPEMAAVIETGARIEAISRFGMDKVQSKAREEGAFALRIAPAKGPARQDLARAIVDASGTWSHPNPLGAMGLPIPGEFEHADRIIYGIPDVLDRDRASYAGRRTVVVGAGYSAANVLVDLVRLAAEHPQTSITWVVRGISLRKVYGAGSADQLPARSALGQQLQQLVEVGLVTLADGFAITGVRSLGGELYLDGETAAGPRRIGPADRIVAATGQRPDLAMTRELRLDLDPWLESARALGPLIDPNLHSCGTVPPHGHRELSHPEPGFYTIGVKSYGRAPTFLLLTGYEQARSVAAAIAGDIEAADNVELVLPETGVCEAPTLEVPGAGLAACCGTADSAISSPIPAEAGQGCHPAA